MTAVGKKRKEDRTWDEALEGEWITKNTVNTVAKLTKETISFINNNIPFCVLQFFFYRMTRIEEGE